MQNQFASRVYAVRSCLGQTAVRMLERFESDVGGLSGVRAVAPVVYSLTSKKGGQVCCIRSSSMALFLTKPRAYNRYLSVDLVAVPTEWRHVYVENCKARQLALVLVPRSPESSGCSVSCLHNSYCKGLFDLPVRGASKTHFVRRAWDAPANEEIVLVGLFFEDGVVAQSKLSSVHLFATVVEFQRLLGRADGLSRCSSTAGGYPLP